MHDRKRNVYNWQTNTLETHPTLDAIRAYQAAEHKRTLHFLADFDPDQWENPSAIPTATITRQHGFSGMSLSMKSTTGGRSPSSWAFSAGKAWMPSRPLGRQR
jgi:hypothetical protein